MKLSFSLPALADLEEIIDYIAQHSPSGAKHVAARIDAVTEMLMLQPAAGVETDEIGIRRIAASPYPYLIFYEVPENEIRIMAVRHGARNPRSMPARQR